MNTIKFSPLADERKETHNVEVFGTNKMKFNGIDYDVYSNVALTIYVTNQCNADCKFCMNKYENNFLKCIEIKDDEEYFERLDYILNYLKPIRPAITITGGEPTKSKKLPDILRLLKKYGYKLRSFSTNGSGLLDVVEGKTVIQHMLENNFVNNINISRMSTSLEQNKKLMKCRDDLTNEQIKTIGRFCKINQMNVRMGCTLQQSGVKNLDELLNYREFYEKLGIDTVIFRELISIDKKNKNYDEYMKEFVDIDCIVQDIERRDDFTYLKTMNGMYYTVKVFRYKDMLVKCYKEKNNVNSDVIRDLIFYANGNLVDTNWNDIEKTLLKYEKGSE